MTTTEAATAPTKPLSATTAVKMYLRSLKSHKQVGPGRPKTDTAIQNRIDKAKNTIKYAQENNNVILELQTTQKLLDAQREMREFKRSVNTAPENFEDDFIKVLPKFSEANQISKAAWRKVGVPALVLQKAGL